MMNSLIVGGLKVGMSVSVACPQGYRPPQEILEFAAGYGDRFELTGSPLQAAKDADVVVTDVWTSMGQEEERKAREAAFAGYCVDEKLMAQAKPDAMVQHSEIAREITEAVFEAKRKVHFRGGGEPPSRPEGRAGKDHGRQNRAPGLTGA